MSTHARDLRRLRPSLILKLALFVILLLIFIQVDAGNNYYFSSTTGDDTRTAEQAKNPLTPWKSISKLNSFFSSLLAGDSVLFKRGELFTGTITPSKSGTAAGTINIGAYGTGAKPIISGFSTVSNWVKEGNGIYSKSINVSSTPNIVTIDGINKPLGRFPKSNYLTVDSHSGNTSITDAATNSATANWTGAEVVIRKAHWIWDRLTITSHSGTIITYSGGGATPLDGYGYFFQQDLKCLTAYGDWAFKSGKLYVYFGSENPDAHIVQVSITDRLVNILSKSYIVVNDLNLQGANSDAIYSTGSYTTIKNCDISFIGNNGVNAWVGASNIKIDGCQITECQNRGIYGIDASPTIRNCFISKIGMFPGMGGNGTTTYSGIALVQAGVTNSLIEYNRLDSIGYNGIAFSANGSVVRFNHVSNYCNILDDGGGIYTGGNNYTGRKIISNICINNNGTTAAAGTTSTTSAINGIYLDNNAADVEITNNTLAYNAVSGIFLHAAHDNKITQNTCYGNKSQLLFETSSNYDLIRNNYISRNIFFSPVSTQYVVEHVTHLTDVSLLGSMDSNKFCRPLLETTMFKTILASATSYRTFDQWKTYSSKDANSSLSPVSANEFLFEYSTFESRTIVLSGTWKSLNNKDISGSLTLPPFSSVVLIRTKETSSNKSPVISNQSFSVAENTANGTLAGTVAASDPDAGQTKTFSIVSGNTNGAFAINASTGAITVASSAALNHLSHW